MTENDSSAEDQALWDKISAGEMSDESLPAAAAAEPGGDGAEEKSAPPQQTPSSANPDDVWSSVPEVARTAYQAVLQQRQGLEHALRSANGRAVRFQQEVEALRKKAADKPAAEVPESRQADGQSQDVDDFDVLRKDYPEIARPVEKLFKSLRDENEALKSRLERHDTSAAEAEYARQAQVLSERHPDWARIADDPQFTAWAQQQPPYVLEALKRNSSRIVNAEEAADIIGRFKAIQGQTQPSPVATPTSQPALSPKRQQQLASAAAPQARSAPKVTGGVPDDPEQAWAYWTAKTAERRRAEQTR